MASIDLEEHNLKKRLEELEKKYNESLSYESEPNLPELGKIVEEPYLPEQQGQIIQETNLSEAPHEQIIEESPETEQIIEEPYLPEQKRQVVEEPLEPKKEIIKKPVLPKPRELFLKKPEFVKQPLKIEEKPVKQVDKEKNQLRFKQKSQENRLSGRINPIEIRDAAEKIDKLKKEISKVLVGQEEIVNGMIRGLLCNSHVLLEGVPGIAKTLAIRALASASGCSVKRVQFTVDMLPTDIIGITSYTPEKGFEIIKGPIFANFLIADEINRAPPKTQSALIEGMQEKQVTIGKESFSLPSPFFVMATENPIENAGVYPLPEAQIDRFLFKLIMGYPEADEEKKIMETNMTLKRFEQFNLRPVINPVEIVKMQELVQKVYLDNNIKDYILSIVKKTREKDFENAQYISYGCSPRASIGLFIASKANALMEGRDYVLPEDVKKIVFDVLRHRLILSYKATIQKISPELLIKEILNSISLE